MSGQRQENLAEMRRLTDEMTEQLQAVALLQKQQEQQCADISRDLTAFKGDIAHARSEWAAASEELSAGLAELLRRTEPRGGPAAG